jgi:hypothetical protein
MLVGNWKFAMAPFSAMSAALSGGFDQGIAPALYSDPITWVAGIMAP